MPNNLRMACPNQNKTMKRTQLMLPNRKLTLLIKTKPKKKKIGLNQMINTNNFTQHSLHVLSSLHWRSIQLFFFFWMVRNYNIWQMHFSFLFFLFFLEISIETLQKVFHPVISPHSIVYRLNLKTHNQIACQSNDPFAGGFIGGLKSQNRIKRWHLYPQFHRCSMTNHRCFILINLSILGCLLTSP